MTMSQCLLFVLNYLCQILDKTMKSIDKISDAFPCFMMTILEENDRQTKTGNEFLPDRMSS